ncbi:MAG: hypothetical protein ACLPVO_13365 [Desulfomonilaceae bacterium]|nr:hypothetical protein [Syntrophaceae bacterium]
MKRIALVAALFVCMGAGLVNAADHIYESCVHPDKAAVATYSKNDFIYLCEMVRNVDIGESTYSRCDGPVHRMRTEGRLIDA